MRTLLAWTVIVQGLVCDPICICPGAICLTLRKESLEHIPLACVKRSGESTGDKDPKFMLSVLAYVTTLVHVSANETMVKRLSGAGPATMIRTFEHHQVFALGRKTQESWQRLIRQCIGAAIITPTDDNRRNCDIL